MIVGPSWVISHKLELLLYYFLHPAVNHLYPGFSFYVKNKNVSFFVTNLQSTYFIFIKFLFIKFFL